MLPVVPLLTVSSKVSTMLALGDTPVELSDGVEDAMCGGWLLLVPPWVMYRFEAFWESRMSTSPSLSKSPTCVCTDEIVVKLTPFIGPELKAAPSGFAIELNEMLPFPLFR